jgi:hypothetical protein
LILRCYEYDETPRYFADSCVRRSGQIIIDNSRFISMTSSPWHIFLTTSMSQKPTSTSHTERYLKPFNYPCVKGVYHSASRNLGVVTSKMGSALSTES